MNMQREEDVGRERRDIRMASPRDLHVHDYYPKQVISFGIFLLRCSKLVQSHIRERCIESSVHTHMELNPHDVK